MPTTANSITYFVAADGTLRDGQQGSIAQTPRINYGTDYAVTLSFLPSTIAEGDQLQVALNRTRTFFSSASATGDAPVAAVAKHDVTAEEAAAQEVTLTLSTNTRAMIDQVNGIDHPVRGFFGVHVLRGQSFVTLAVADALMMSLESGPDAISPSLPVVDYPTREEAEALTERSENAAERAEQAAAGIVPPLQLDAPPTTSTVGSVGQLAVWHDSTTNKDHLYHLCFVSEGESATLYHWEECVLLDTNGKVPNAYLPIHTIQKGAGEQTPAVAIPAVNGVVSIPIGGNTPQKRGLVYAENYYGVFINGYGAISINAVTNAEINNRTVRRYMGLNNLDYAVRSVLPNVTEIPAATSDYSLVDSSATTNNHSHVYSHAPTTAPTYRLPQVTNTTISHYIELTVDFTAVQTYSFLDHQGEPIVPLFTPSIAAGDVYTFKIEYSAIKAAWLIYPQKQGAVADDFVMRGEVGAANGVAGLDANAKVPSVQLPIAKSNVLGCGKFESLNGVSIDGSGNVFLTDPTAAYLLARRRRIAITAQYLNDAVTAAITDSNHITLTDAQKATAQSVFGVGGPITAIPAATSAYTLAEGIFTHAPTNAPTYTLPNITDDIRTHEVVLIIDFSSVQTFSFLVDGGGDVTFQSYANPTTGDVWAFRCWWYGGKWRIAPTKIKNCVTRQLANGSLAITDAVAGDALALKMTAPRSVVVNQQVRNGNFSDDTTDWTASGSLPTVTNNVITCICNTSLDYFGIQQGNINLLSEHVYLRHVEAKVNYSATAITLAYNPVNQYSSPPANTWLNINYKVTQINDDNRFRILATGATSAADVLELRNIMVVDLTQYFNGDTALIDSIQTWDDLVAYDPRFANYVEYNAGTVTGAQPTVKVSGKNLFDKSKLATDYGYTANTETVDGRTCAKVYGNSLPYNTGNNSIAYVFPIPQSCAISLYAKKANTNQSLRLTIEYSNGTIGSMDIAATDTWTQFVKLPAKPVKRLTFNNGANGPQWSAYIDIDTIQIELGSTATSYEPYHDGGTAQAPAPLFAVGNAADEYEAVAGRTEKAFKQVDLSTLTWTAGEGTYSATIADIKPSTQNILLPNGYAGTVSGTTLTITASATPSGTAIYESAAHATSITTPTQIALQAGNNTAMQTDGGRLATIDITYESDEI